MRTNAALPPRASNALTSIGLKLANGQALGPDVAEAVSLLNTLDARSLAKAEREIVEAAALYRWRRTPSIIEKLFKRRVTDADQLSTVGGLEYIFLFHRDGRLREAALRKVSGPLPSPFVFAAVAWRLNDWVEPVRTAAAECAARAFPVSQASTIADAATVLLTRQATWGRWSAEKRVLDAAFQRHDVVTCLADIVRHRLTGPMASLLRQVLRAPSVDEHLQRLSTEAAQPSVRATALHTLINGNAEWPVGWRWRWIDKSMGVRRHETAFESRPLSVQAEPETTIRTGLADRSAVVRNAAMSGLIQKQATVFDAKALAEPLLKDRSRAVREKAQFVMNRADVAKA